MPVVPADSSKASVMPNATGRAGLATISFATVIGGFGGGRCRNRYRQEFDRLRPRRVAKKPRRVNELKNVSAISHAGDRAMSEE